MSELFQALNKNNQNQNAMIAQFEKFKNSFKGNPQEKVQELLNSGQMTQEQYNYLQSVAAQFITLLKK